MPYRLGVDLGTTFTAAAAVTNGSEPTVIGLGNRALQIPSVLFLKPDGEFLVGEAAEQRGLTEPDRLAHEFKRRIGDPVPIMVGGAPISPQALTAHLLRWVVDAATERMGEPPSEVVLTHPANWGPFQIELLDQVAVMAGVASARRCTEPEAAAAQYAAQTRVSPGERVAVYDLGGGTFDACVLEKTDTGFQVLGNPEGVEHLGGVDFDEAVLRHVLTTLNATHGPVDPEDPEVRVSLARLRRACAEAKEALSTDVDTLVPVALPGLSSTVPITRAEFEPMIRPALTETIAAMNRALRNAGLEPSELRSILLVGGSSRIPLVSEMLHREFSVRALDIRPKPDVALGSVRVGHDEADFTTAAPPPITPAPGPAAASPAPGPGAASLDPGPAAAPVAPPPAVPPDGGGDGWHGTPPAGGEGGAAGAWAAPPQMVGASSRPRGGVARALAVVLAAILLGVGTGVFIALRDKGTVAGPPVTSSPPATVVSTPVVSPTPSPSPTPTVAIPQSARPLGNEVIVWPRIRNGNWDIALLDLNSGKETRLTTNALADSFPVITRDRRSIFYTRVTNSGPVLRVMGADGKGDRQFFDKLPDGCQTMRRPATTPDGLLVVMCSATAKPERELLNVITLDGRLVRRLASIGRMADPTVTADGKSVVYWRNDKGNGDGGALYRAAIDGKSDPVQLTDSGDGVDADPVCSLDGKRIAFRRIIDGKRFVVAASFNGKALTSTPQPVTKGENDQDPSWSPDGRRIAYKQGPNANADLRVVDLQSGKSTVVVDNPEPDTAPAWTPR